MSEPLKIDPRIAGYVAEVSRPGIPFISHSHRTLIWLYEKHGRGLINQLLEDHWAAVRELEGLK